MFVGVSGSSLLLSRLQNPGFLSLLLSGVTTVVPGVAACFCSLRLSFLSFLTFVGDSSHSPSINTVVVLCIFLV